MKIIRYEVKGYTGKYNFETEEVDQVEVLATIERPYSEANEELDKKESYNGEYSIEDDGRLEQESSDAKRIAELEEALALLLSGVTE